MDLDEAVDALTSADPDEAVEALEGTRVHKQIRSAAYKQGQDDKEEEFGHFQEKTASLRKEKKELKEKIEQLEEEQPDEAELIGKYEEKLEQKQKRINELEEEKNEVEDTWRSRTQSVKQGSFEERTAAALKSQGVDEDYAEFKAKQAVSSKRVTFDENLNVKVYEDEDQAVPLHANGDPAHKAFAEDIVQEVPDKFIDDDRPGSTGVGDTSGGGRGRTIPRDEFENLSPAKKSEMARDPEVEVVDQ